MKAKSYMNEVETNTMVDSRHWRDARACPCTVCSLGLVPLRVVAIAQKLRGLFLGHPSRLRPVESPLVCWLRTPRERRGDEQPQSAGTRLSVIWSAPSLSPGGFGAVLSAEPRFLVSGFQPW